MDGYRKKTISGMKWTYLSTFLAKGLHPVILIILARLLDPADFGVVAMAVAVTSLLTCFSDIGLKHALLQQTGDNEKIASLAFWILLPVGFVWFVLIWIAAPYVALYFQNDQVVPLLRVLGLMFIIQPFSDVPLAILLRDLQFKALFYRQLIPQVFSGITSIALALLGFGAWSLIVGTLAGITGTALFVWRTIDWRPVMYFDSSLFKSMFRFGSFVSIQNVLGWLMVRASYLFVGRFLGASSLGIFRMGHTFGSMPLQIIGTPFHNVIYPLLCKININRDEVKEKYLLYIKWISAAIIPLSIAYIYVSPLLIPVLLGDKWLSVIPVLQFMAVAAMLASVVGVNAEVYKAVGRPDISVKFFSVRVLVSLPVCFFAAQKSIIALTYALVGLSCFFVPINIFICSRVLGLGYLQVIKKVKTGVILGLISVVLGSVYGELIINMNLIDNTIINALCLISLYVIIGGSSLYLIDRKMFMSVHELIRNTFIYKVEGAASWVK